VCGRHGEKRKFAGFLWGNLKESDCLEDLDIGGRIILKWVVKK
jgi:hypothetical protein